MDLAVDDKAFSNFINLNKRNSCLYIFYREAALKILKTREKEIFPNNFHFSQYLFRQLLLWYAKYSKRQCPANIYLIKDNNRNTGKRCEIRPKLTLKTPERRHWRRSGVFMVNFEHTSHLFLVFLLLTLNE